MPLRTWISSLFAAAVPSRNVVLNGLAGIVLALAPGTRAGAQCIAVTDPLCPTTHPPRVTLSFPGTNTSTVTTASITISVALTADVNLDSTKYSFKQNNVVQTANLWPEWLINRGSTSKTSDFTLVQGPNTFIARVEDTQGLAGADTVVITYAPPPQPPQQAAPVVRFAAFDTTVRPASPCGGCASAFAYTTPPYVSLDQPRSLTVAYSSATAAPAGLVMLDAVMTSASNPTTISIRLWDPVHLIYMAIAANGSTENFYLPDASAARTTRVAAQFDASALSTGRYHYIAEVTANFNGTNLTTSQSVQVLILNQTPAQGAYLGYGMSFVGIPQLFPAADGSGVLLAPGDGSVAFFKAGCAGCYYLPSGYFSTLGKVGGMYQLTGTDGSAAAFDTASGRVLFMKDRFSNQTNFTYVGGRLTTVTDPAGQTITVAYAGTGASTTVTITDTPLNRASTLRYDAAGTSVVYVQRPDGAYAIVNAQYNSSHRLLSAGGLLGAQTTVSYDANGWVNAVSLAGPGGVLATTDSVTALPTKVLPAFGRGSSASTADLGTNPTTAATRIRAANGTITTASLDPFALPLRLDVTDPAGRVQRTTWTRNTAGQPTSVVDPQGQISEYTYYGPQVATASQNGETVSTAYDAFFQPTSVVHGSTVMAWYYYSGALAKLDSTKQGTAKTAYQWDTKGRPLSTVSPGGTTTTWGYESSGLQNTNGIGQTLPYGGMGSTQVARDNAGRVTSAVDPQGHTSIMAYDTLNRVTRTQDAVGAVTTVVTNDPGHLRQVVDARGNVTTYYFDHLGRDTAIVDPNGARQRFVYDVRGNLSQRVNRRGQNTWFTYDSLGRVRTRLADGDTAVFSYDARSNATGVPTNGWMVARNPASKDSIAFDAMGRPDRLSTWRAGQLFNYTWVYDQLVTGQQQLTVRYPSGDSITAYVSYDNQFRIAGLLPDKRQATAFTYSAANLLQTITLPTSTTEASKLKGTMTYGPAEQLTSLAYNQPAIQQSLGRSYAQDAVGRTTAIVQAYGNGQQARELSYDVVGRLTNYADHRTWTDSTYVCPDDEFTSCYWQVVTNQSYPNAGAFTWDAVGNWATTTGVVVGPGNRLTSYAGYTLAYDLDGNLVSKTGNGLTQTFAWNSLGQLASVTTTTVTPPSTVTTTFAYDAWGRRVQKTTPGVGTSNYLLDGATLVAELNAALQPVREYTYYPGTDRPHSVRTGGTAGATYYYLYEEPGHVVGLVNATGTLVNQYTYAPFGAALSTTEAVAQPLRFTARELDNETGLYYYRARYYDPALARFVSEDPIGLGGGINQYAYVGDDPVNFTDPSGMCPFSELVITIQVGGNTWQCPGGSIFSNAPYQSLSPVIITADRYDGPFSTNFGNRGSKMDQLPPEFRRDVTAVMGMMQQDGNNTRIYYAFRTRHEQDSLKKRGYTPVGGCYSNHNFWPPLAVDIVSTRTGYAPDSSLGMGRYAAKVGVTWGGNFSTFYDPGHLEVASIPDRSYLIAVCLASQAP